MKGGFFKPPLFIENTLNARSADILHILYLYDLTTYAGSPLHKNSLH